MGFAADKAAAPSRLVPVQSASTIYFDEGHAMARGINKVILIGNLGADPETRAMPSGMTVANIRIATSGNWKDKQSGENKERTEWHNVAMFGRLGEIAEGHDPHLLQAITAADGEFEVGNRHAEDLREPILAAARFLVVVHVTRSVGVLEVEPSPFVAGEDVQDAEVALLGTLEVFDVFVEEAEVD
jgi:hypothetical protein